jgi:8-oxo-dGTP pyrophosphatase MutT (NUDIX family)/ribosomal protein S18 acetylase RimI-like enzyme
MEVDDLDLRPATHGDREFLYELHKAALGLYIAETWGWDESFQRAHFDERFDPAPRRLILWKGASIGCFTYRVEEDAIELDYIAVLPEFQSGGIGTRLIGQLIDRSEQMGLPIRLHVLRANPARALYERLGFVTTREDDARCYMERNPASERFDVYDEGWQPRGKTLRRGEPLAPGEYHLVVQVWVQNSRGEFLIQKRATGLAEAPGQWATTAGWVQAGEAPVETAIRELAEELAVLADASELREVLRNRVGNTLESVWLLVDEEPPNPSPNPREVSEVRWTDADEIRRMVQSRDFFDYGTDYFERLFGSVGWTD